VMSKNLAYRFSRRNTSSTKLAQFTESPASEAVNLLFERIDEYKTYTGDFTYRMRKQCASSQTLIESGKRVTECLESFHQKCAQANSDPVLVECFDKTKLFQLNFFDLFSRLNTTLDNKIGTRLANCTRDEFAAVKQSKKSFQKAKTAYESALTANTKSKKGKDNEAEIATAKENYFLAGNETLTILKDSVTEVELHLLQAFCDYWDAFYDFQTKSAKWVSNIRPLVENYRTHWEELSAQHAEEKKNRRSTTNSFKDAASSKVFGCPLSELMSRTDGDVPKFIDDSITYLHKIAPNLEGVFRISAMKSALTEAQEVIDSGKRLEFSDLPDLHIVPALFKQFLRELPEPLLTFELYGSFVKANLIESDTARLEELRSLVKKLPEANRAILKRLLNLLGKIADNQDLNKMGPTNLSTVIGPNILYDREINPLTMVEDMENANSIIVTLISKFQEIFKIEDPIEAARENEYAALVRLKSEGKDILCADKDGMTALHYAAKHTNLDMIEFLLETNSDSDFIDAVDNSGRTALMVSCKSDDRSQLIAQYLLNAGCNIEIKNKNGKTALDLAAEISSEFHQVLLDTKESLEAPPPAAEPEPEKIESPKQEKQDTSPPSPTPEEKPQTPRQEEKTVETPEETKPELEPTKPEPAAVAPVAKPAPAPVAKPVVRETPEQIAERAKLKAASLLRSKTRERSDTGVEDEDVNAIIFERVRSLQSLVTQDIPLQSVYSLVNVEEMTQAAFALVKATLPEKFGAPEIAALNGTLKLSADALKNLFAVVKKFAALFADDDKKEVLSNALNLQGTVKVLFNAVKQLNSKPTDETLRENLLTAAKQIVDGVYKFFKFCEVASAEYISTTADTCAEQVTKIVEAGSGVSKDDLDNACKNAALSILKMSQLVKSKAAQCCHENIRVSLSTSSSILERSTLELINECKKLWAQGAKPNDDTNTLAKKVLLEFRQINNTLLRASKETTFSLQEQGDRFNVMATSVSEIVQQLMDIEFSSDLDKALVLQMRLIGRKLESFVSIETLDGKSIMSITQEVGDTLKKIRVGMAAMEKKSRDASLNRRMKVWAEALLNFMLAIRLSVCALVLKLPSEREMQLSVKMDGVVVQCSEFYQFLIELRSG